MQRPYFKQFKAALPIFSPIKCQNHHIKNKKPNFLTLKAFLFSYEAYLTPAE